MIAYLFFHHVAVGADATEYEDGLKRFHAVLAEARVQGFIGSRTYRVGGGYCDWYLVESSAVLDALNDAAVSGARTAPHAEVARSATDFAGKLLKLAAGTYDPEASHEIRFSKPRGLSYPELYRRLEPWTERPGISAWRRMMVLGPGPEFCLIAASEEELPPELDGEVLRRQPI